MTESAAAADPWNARVRDLALRIEGSPLEPLIRRFHEEWAARGFRLRLPVYLSDEWGCPNEAPIIAIPFYHADERLRQIEQEKTGALESDEDILRTLRHEAGHAFNYAYRLWERSQPWRRLFGDFRAPYRERYTVRPFDDRFVRVLPGWYAQKHPDEDFAETFAAWLDPETDWCERYAGWRAREKLEYVDRVAVELADAPPVVSPPPPIHSADEMDVTVETYYRSRTEALPLPNVSFFDDELRALFHERDRADDASAALVDLTALVTAAVTHERWRDATAS